jgi:hypothetical protein
VRGLSRLTHLNLTGVVVVGGLTLQLEGGLVGAIVQTLAALPGLVALQLIGNEPMRSDAIAVRVAALARLTHLQISQHEVPWDSMPAMCAGLTALVNLRSLDMMELSFQRDARVATLVQSLPALSHLQRLPFQHLKVQHVRSILCTFSRPAQLTHLVLKFMAGSSQAEELFEQVDSLIGMRRLQVSVHVRYLPCRAHLGPQLRWLPQLQWLNLESNFLGQGSVAALAPALQMLSSLTCLKLGGNWCALVVLYAPGKKERYTGTRCDVNPLAQTLAALPSIAHLELQYNNLLDSGLTALAPSLVQLTCLS